MGPTLIGGLPAHILLVHAVVVLLPLAALVAVVCAAWPAWNRRLGVTLPLLALVALVSVPLATHAGEWLEHHVDSDTLVRRHTELGDTVLPWALGLFVVAVAVWLLGRWSGRATTTTDGAAVRGPGVALRVLAVLLSLAVGAGTVVQVYRTGESGARAAWHDGFSKEAVRPHPKGHDAS